MVKLDENFGDKKMNFWKKLPKLAFLKKKVANKKNIGSKHVHE
jgi:hypothetical protein